MSDELPQRVAGTSLPPGAYHAAGQSSGAVLPGEQWRWDEQTLRVLLDGLRDGDQGDALPAA